MGDSHKRPRNTWPIKVLVITIVLTVLISLFSDMAIGDSTNILIIAVVLIVLIILGLISDIIGVAVTSADARPFVSMAAKRVPGAQTGLWLIKNADRVSSMCNDVIGDICGIVSGTAGAAMAAVVLLSTPNTTYQIISIGVSAIIAGITTGSKAIGKNIAMRYSREIVLLSGHALAFAIRERKNGRKR